MSSINPVNTYAYNNNKSAVKPSAEKESGKSVDNTTNAGKKKDAEISVKKQDYVADDSVYTKKTAKNEKNEKSEKNEQLSRISSQIDYIQRQNAERLIQMVLDTINTQGGHGSKAARKFENAIFEIKDYLEGGGSITEEQKSAAAAAIAEDGYWGVEAVSDRLVEAALSFAGGDESKYNMMKSAIEAGFKSAEAMWGGKLPDISYKTFDATMKKLETAFNQGKQTEQTAAS